MQVTNVQEEQGERNPLFWGWHLELGTSLCRGGRMPLGVPGALVPQQLAQQCGREGEIPLAPPGQTRSPGISGPPNTSYLIDPPESQDAL